MRGDPVVDEQFTTRASRCDKIKLVYEFKRISRKKIIRKSQSFVPRGLGLRIRKLRVWARVPALRRLRFPPVFQPVQPAPFHDPAGAQPAGDPRAASWCFAPPILRQAR